MSDRHGPKPLNVIDISTAVGCFHSDRLALKASSVENAQNAEAPGTLRA